jgi:hypothetical protein
LTTDSALHGRGESTPPCSSDVHQFQAGVVAGDQVGHRDTEQFAEDGAQFRQPVQAAVVADVGAVAVAIGVPPGQFEQPVRQVELFR